MPTNDWTRVSAETFQAFHRAPITHSQETLTEEQPPETYYALGEQRPGDFGTDVLTPKTSGANDQKDLTLVSYTASHPIKAWIEPYSVCYSLTGAALSKREVLDNPLINAA